MGFPSFSGNERILRAAEEHPEATGGTTDRTTLGTLLRAVSNATIYTRGSSLRQPGCAATRAMGYRMPGKISNSRSGPA